MQDFFGRIIFHSPAKSKSATVMRRIELTASAAAIVAMPPETDIWLQQYRSLWANNCLAHRSKHHSHSMISLVRPDTRRCRKTASSRRSLRSPIRSFD